MIRDAASPGEHRSFAPWRGTEPPRRILLIRLHAIGDVALVLPGATALHTLFPGSHIAMLTTPAASGLPGAVIDIDDVIAPDYSSRRAARFLSAISAGLRVRKGNYDLILDFQRNRFSRLIRVLAAPASWGEFERYAFIAAWERIVDTCRRTGIAIPPAPPAVRLRAEARASARQLLASHGRTPEKQLVVLNPAGLWDTRNWPVAHYVELGKLWKQTAPVQFLLLGTERMRDRAAAIAGGLTDEAINLTGMTTLPQALACVAESSIMISEDSGLMHAAWAAGVPIVALFGSSNHERSAPFGPRAVTLHSGDLPCAACMEPMCKFGDVHCLTRRTPAMVLAEALQLIQRTQDV